MRGTVAGWPAHLKLTLAASLGLGAWTVLWGVAAAVLAVDAGVPLSFVRLLAAQAAVWIGIGMAAVAVAVQATRWLDPQAHYRRSIAWAAACVRNHSLLATACVLAAVLLSAFDWPGVLVALLLCTQFVILQPGRFGLPARSLSAQTIAIWFGVLVGAFLLSVGSEMLITTAGWPDTAVGDVVRLVLLVLDWAVAEVLALLGTAALLFRIRMSELVPLVRASLKSCILGPWIALSVPFVLAFVALFVPVSAGTALLQYVVPQLSHDARAGVIESIPLWADGLSILGQLDLRWWMASFIAFAILASGKLLAMLKLEGLLFCRRAGGEPDKC